MRVTLLDRSTVLVSLLFIAHAVGGLRPARADAGEPNAQNAREAAPKDAAEAAAKPAEPATAEENGASAEQPKAKPGHAGRWTVFPVFASAPETSLMLGGIAMFHFRVGNPGDRGSDGRAARRSSVGLFAAYTLKNQFLFSLWPSVYLQGETWHLSASVDASWFPDTLYATGRESPSDSAEDFTQRGLALTLSATRRLLRAFRVGLRGMAAHAALTDVEPGGLLDTDQIPGSNGGAVVGLGPTLLWDDRDQDMAPRTGSKVQLSLAGFHSVIGSDYDYAQITLDARRYIPLPRQHVLALQAYGELGYGDVPFQTQARLGGDSRLRGFFAGRYRDDHMLAVQVEYRLPVYWRVGASVFAGTGDVAGSIGEFDALDLKYAGGVGLRVALNPKDRVNLRGDLAATNEGHVNFYIALGEAF